MLAEISIYPNPFHYFINIEMTSPDKRHVIISLTDQQNSKLIRLMGVGLNEGGNKIPIVGLHSLANGDYQLTIKNTRAELIYEIMLLKR